MNRTYSVRHAERDPAAPLAGAGSRGSRFKLARILGLGRRPWQ